MPVIAFANSKGGSGKTTSALLLACELAEKTAVTIIDADPRHPVTKWAAAKEGKTGLYSNQIKGQPNEPKFSSLVTLYRHH